MSSESLWSKGADSETGTRAEGQSEPRRALRGFVKAEDVARLAGVSRSAVSRTFTPGASVSEGVRQRVQEAAKALGYRVNRLAQGLISEETNFVGVVGANLAAPFMANQLDNLSRALLSRGLQCLLLNAADGTVDLSSLVELMLEYRVRAIVIMSGVPPAAIVEECLRNGVRVILINRYGRDRTADAIDADDVQGARLAVDRLIAAGIRHPAMIASSARTPSQIARAQAFTELMSAHGLAVREWWEGRTSYETGVAAAEALCREGPVDGVFCVNDLMALGFLDAVRHRLGARVPDDVSVIGYDDIAIAAWQSYRLTTIAMDPDTITDAVLHALDREDEQDAMRIVFPVTLVERDTVRAPA